MVVLTIQPIVYQDELDGLGTRLIEIFDPILGSFVVNRGIELDELDKDLFYNTEKVELEGDKLVEYLRKLGDLVLGVTTLNTRVRLGNSRFYMAYGGGGLERVAFVSTYYSLQMRPKEVLTKVAAHEVGHGLGLVHHVFDMKTPSGLSCLMVYTASPLIGRPIITIGQAYEVDYGFCEGCYEQLMKKHVPQLV